MKAVERIASARKRLGLEEYIAPSHAPRGPGVSYAQQMVEILNSARARGTLRPKTIPEPRTEP